jgi:signal transduction histidine kinase
VGIAPKFADRGKEGHFGLDGMRERAARIASKLTVASSANSGTEINLIVPGSIIYRDAASGRRGFSAKLKPVLRRMGFASNGD